MTAQVKDTVDVVEETAVEPPSEDTPGSEQPGAVRPRGPRWLWVLSALVLVAAVVLAVTLGRSAHDRAQQADNDAAATAAARQMVVNFTTLDYTTFDAYKARVLDGATGEFKDEWSKQADQLKSLVTDNQTTSAPQQTEVGLSSSDSDSAEAIVGAVVPTKNKSAPAGVTKTYRIDVKLEKVSGDWKVSSLVFVG